MASTGLVEQTDGSTAPTSVTLSPYKWFYRLKGQPQHPKVCFLHGFLGCHQDFDGVMDSITLNASIYTLTLDLPGHGQTEVFQTGQSYDGDGYAMDAIATGLIELLQSLKFWPCHLMGYSMGGRLALYLACRFPQYFQSVFLVSASPGLATEQEQQQRQTHDQQWAIALESGSWPTFLEQWYQQPLFTTLRQHPTFETIRHRRAQNRPRDLAKILRVLGTGVQPSLWGELAHLSCPVTLVVGALDNKFVQINQKMKNNCPQAQLTIVPNCGHSVHSEAPQLLAQILTTHIF